MFSICSFLLFVNNQATGGDILIQSAWQNRISVKELTISFYLGRSAIQKMTQNENKDKFLFTFIPRYLNLEVNNSRTLITRYATISCWSNHLSEVFLTGVTVPLRFGNTWYFCIRLLMSNRLLEKCSVSQKNYTKDILYVTAANTSSQITVMQ